MAQKLKAGGSDKWPHHYLFIVDGEWRDDPDCPLRVPNPHGGQNMVRQVVSPTCTLSGATYGHNLP
jgi:hypothetical protein